jgi:hypothetical protein
MLASAVPAGAATQIGQTSDPTEACVADHTWLQPTAANNAYTVPIRGVITSWSFEGGSTPPPQIRFKVGRPAGGDNFTIVGRGGFEAPAAFQLNTYANLQIPVEAGDVIGFYIPDGGFDCVFGGGPDDTLRVAAGDVPPGTTAAFSSFTLFGRIDVSALVEPDCDSDGLGDETQDGDLSVCAPPGVPPDTALPTATITAGPKNRTKKKKAKFEFTGTDARAIASFECSLDGAAFATCTSPHKVKVKKGKHTFEVRAVDDAGNVGTPASDDWKRKKKRRS